MKRYTILFLTRYRSLEQELLPSLGAHYTVSVAQTRREAIAVLNTQQIDLIMADVSTLRFDLVRFWDDARARNPDMRFFLLLEKGIRLDQVPRSHGYLRHTFSLSQLLRRLARVLPTHQGEVVAWRGLRLDIQGHFLIWDVRQVALTPKQVALVQAFLREPLTLISRAQLMQDVWGTNYMGDTRTLDVHIHGMRKLLKRLQAPFVLETERGKGYRLVCSLPESVG
ncbi:MAG: winged-helix domain-containing protein [Anaerolineae bacterium]|nr:winged-helix domain-containing protein [Anaerolineae bacterium]